MSYGHSLLMSAILQNLAKAPWQEKDALLRQYLSVISFLADILYVVFCPSGIVTILSLKNAVYRNFIFGLAMAQRSESRV